MKYFALLWAIVACVTVGAENLASVPGITLKNGDFADFKPGRAAPAGWFNNSKNIEITPNADGGIAVKIIAGHPYLGSLEQTLKNIPSNQKLRVCGWLAGSKSNIALIQVKLLKDGKEISRTDSKRNTKEGSVVWIDLETKDADSMSVHCRQELEGNVGETVIFKDLQIGEIPPPPREADLVVTPGFVSAGIFVNNLSQTAEFTAAMRFRELPAGEWQRALPPVYAAADRQARGVVVNLKENTDYELKVDYNDGAAKSETVKFTTRNPEVTVAQTVYLDADNFKGSLKITESGRADGYIKYTAKPGTVLTADDSKSYAVSVDGASFIILENLTVRGGNYNGIELNHANFIRVINCDIAGYGTPRLPYNLVSVKEIYRDNGKNINNQAGICIRGGSNLLIERNFIHDPRSKANPWFYCHPSGPNAIFAGETENATVRYNDFIGSDQHRWNDAVESSDNGSLLGSFYKNAEIYGNYFAVGNDDGIELDGGQINTRFFGNKLEATLCGISTAPCLAGPSYYFANLIVNPGEEFRFTNTAVKNNYGVYGTGQINLYNNMFSGNFGGVSDFGGTIAPEDLKTVKLIGRNNIFETNSLYASGIFKAKADLDYDVFCNVAADSKHLQTLDTNGQEKHRTLSGKLIGSPRWQLNQSIPGEIIANFNPDGKAGSQLRLPVRPAKFETSVDQVNLSSKQLSFALTVKADTDFAGDFTIMQPAAATYFKVIPTSGKFNPGGQITLTVSAQPDLAQEARIHSGGFIIKDQNGNSRPVAVYFDNSDDLAKVAAARKDAVYGQVAEQTGEVAKLVFDVPHAGKYYLFVKVGPSPWSVNVSLDGKELESMIFLRTKSPDPSVKLWSNLGASTYGGKANLPIELAAGKHEFVLGRRTEMPEIVSCALAAGPEAFLLAPFSDVAIRK